MSALLRCIGPWTTNEKFNFLKISNSYSSVQEHIIIIITMTKTIVFLAKKSIAINYSIINGFIKMNSKG